jgi:hypothetical protein
MLKTLHIAVLEIDLGHKMHMNIPFVRSINFMDKINSIIFHGTCREKGGYYIVLKALQFFLQI